MCHSYCGLPFTQKGMSMLALKNSGAAWPLSTENVSRFTSFCRDAKAVGIKNAKYPIFARPCPERPRHGFVESRVIRNKKELRALVKEVEKASRGDEWEIALVQEIDAEWSAVLTPSGVSIGPGNDGATSGRDSVFVGAKCGDLLDCLGIDKRAAGVTGFPYIEVVSNGETVELVQVRDGPEVGTDGNSFIPKTTRVRRVVLAEGNLLKWERITKNFKPGDVVWHKGGTMASHYAVHCVANRIPIVCSTEAPRSGEVLRPNVDERKWDVRSICTKILEFDKKYRTSGIPEDCALFSAAALHAFPSMTPSPEAEAIIAKGIVCAYRMGAEACADEMLYDECAMPVSGSSAKSSDILKSMRYAAHRFVAGGFGENYGGDAWADCAEAVGATIGAAARMMRLPTQKSLSRAISAWNLIIDAEHNCALLLSKYTNDETEPFSVAACAPAVVLVANGELFKTLYKSDGTRREFFSNLSGSMLRAEGRRFGGEDK